MPETWSEIMRDAANGVTGKYHIERDDGRVETLEVSDYIQPVSEWSEIEQIAIKHAKGKVLDIGCGAGRVALYLQILGHDVVGIDLAPGAIEASRIMGVGRAYVMSASDLHFKDDVFDTVVLFGNNFGVAGDEDHIVKMLRQLHGITTPDAIILAGTLDPLNTEDSSHLEYQKKNRERNRPPGLVRIRVKYKDLVGEWSDLWLVTPDEMKLLAKKAGWQLEKTIQIDGVSQYVGILTKS
ncbi:MAG: class I SAM-dependent methyltransferase [Candidatus Thorarchaeota archaeon]